MTKDENSILRYFIAHGVLPTNGVQQGSEQESTMDDEQQKPSVSSEDTELTDETRNEVMEAGAQNCPTHELVRDIWYNQTEPLAYNSKLVELGKKFEEAIFEKIGKMLHDIGSLSDRNFIEKLFEIARQDETVIKMKGRGRHHRMPLPKVITTLIKNYLDKVMVVLEKIKEAKELERVGKPVLDSKSVLEPATSTTSSCSTSKPIEVCLELVRKVWNSKIKPPVHDPKFNELGKKLTEAICKRVTNDCNGIKSDEDFFEVLECLILEDEVVKTMINGDSQKCLPPVVYDLFLEYSKKKEDLEYFASKPLPALTESQSTSRRSKESSSTSSATSKIHVELVKHSSETTKPEKINHEKSVTVDFVRGVFNDRMIHIGHDPKFKTLSEKFQKAVFVRVANIWNSNKVGPLCGFIELLERLASQDEVVKKMISKWDIVLDCETGLPLEIVEMINDYLGIENVLKAIPETGPSDTTESQNNSDSNEKLFDGGVSQESPTTGDNFSATQKIRLVVEAITSSTPKSENRSGSNEKFFDGGVSQESPTIKSSRSVTASTTPKIHVTAQIAEEVWNNTMSPPEYDPKLESLAKKLRGVMFMISVNAINNQWSAVAMNDFKRMLCIAAEDELTKRMLTNRKEPIHSKTSLPLKVFNLVLAHAGMMVELMTKVEDKIKSESAPSPSKLETQKEPESLVSNEPEELKTSTDKPNQEAYKADELVKAKPKPKPKKQPSEASSSTASVKRLAPRFQLSNPAVNPPRLSRKMLKQLSRTREIKARNYRPDGPYKKYRSPKRALAPQEQEESAACKKCWRMSKRLMINRKKHRSSRIMLEKFRDKAMRYDELERKLEQRDRTIAELERSSIDFSDLEQKLKEMEEHLKEKDRKIAELEGHSKVDKNLAQKIADLEQKLKESQENVRKLEMEQKKNGNSVKPTTSSSYSQTASSEDKNLPVLREQEEAGTHPAQAELMSKMLEEMSSMRKMIELNHKEIEDLKRSPPSCSVSDEAISSSALKREIDFFVKQSTTLKQELSDLKNSKVGGMTFAEVETLKEDKERLLKELELSRRNHAIAEVTINKHEETINELVVKYSQGPFDR